MQCRAHDEIVLRLLSLLGLNPEARRAPEWVSFQGGGSVEFVELRPETLVPSASNRSTPEWNYVDSAKGIGRNATSR